MRENFSKLINANSEEIAFVPSTQIGESFVAGFRLVMVIGAGLALLSAVCAWLTLDASRFRSRR